MSEQVMNSSTHTASLFRGELFSVLRISQTAELSHHQTFNKSVISYSVSVGSYQHLGDHLGRAPVSGDHSALYEGFLE